MRGGRSRRAAGVLLAWMLAACATGGDPEITTQAYDGPAPDDGFTGTGVLTSGFTDGGEDGPATGDGTGLPDFGSCTDDGDCVLPAGTCLEVQGECVQGQCEHGAAAPGSPCDDADACTTADACDGEGVCYGVSIDCGSGECVAGECMGGDCPAGFADCNSNAMDGCEVQLGTNSDCGGCGDTCSAGAHATASCSAGSCTYQCQAPYDNCDGNWANGCEVPVGVEHQCSASGLDANGCWTAYCGASANPNATNFGSYYCMDCATCRVPSAGQCQWCNHTSGTFYPQDACACGAYEDLSC